MKKSLSIASAIKTAEKKGGLKGIENTSFVVEEEHRTAVVSVKLKPSEKIELMDILGRGSMSDLGRELFLEYIKKNKNDDR